MTALSTVTPNDVMAMGLEMGAGICIEDQKYMSKNSRAMIFQAHYGSSPLDIADVWYDLQVGEHEGATLTEKENTTKGFRMFMMAHFYLFTKPKNSELLASRFGVCERYCRGKPLWKWVHKIAALKQKKIKWDKKLWSGSTEQFVASIDCVDCMYKEPQHPLYNIDKKYYSQKFNHAGLKYEIVLSINEEKCMSIRGPFKCGMPDMDVFRTETKKVLQSIRRASQKNKMIVGDSKYRQGRKQPNEEGLFPPPSITDSEVLKKFKSRVRCRHETFNGRIKNFAFLANRTKVSEENHKAAMEAICVIIQYQMDNGSPIFCAK